MPERTFARSFIAAVLVAIVLPLGALPASGDTPTHPSDGDLIEGRYIVGFVRSVNHPVALSEQLESEDGFDTSLRYRHAFSGFSAALTPFQVELLRRHPKVAFVVPDREV